jgi:arylsulfatase A-like enzyme
MRAQFHHVIDIAATILDVAGLPEPAFVNGIQQMPLHGVSMRYCVLVLTDGEREELARWARASPPRRALRARIVLACAEPGMSHERVAAGLGTTTETVVKWRRAPRTSRSPQTCG